MTLDSIRIKYTSAHHWPLRTVYRHAWNMVCVCMCVSIWDWSLFTKLQFSQLCQSTWQNYPSIFHQRKYDLRHFSVTEAVDESDISFPAVLLNTLSCLRDADFLCPDVSAKQCHQEFKCFHFSQVVPWCKMLLRWWYWKFFSRIFFVTPWENNTFHIIHTEWWWTREENKMF